MLDTFLSNNPITRMVEDLVGKVTDLIPDTRGKEEALRGVFTNLVAAIIAQQQAQAEVNKQEAAHASIFVAGWRPAIGWACAFGVFYTVSSPIIEAILLTAFPDTAIVLPALGDVLWELTFGMLGMGALRTFEKLKGVARMS
jgi:hypothetical protein